MPETETHTVCRECGALDTIEAVDDGRGGGVYRCAGCLAQVGVWLDGGVLDLGVVREAVERDDSVGAFEVFPPL